MIPDVYDLDPAERFPSLVFYPTPGDPWYVNCEMTCFVGMDPQTRWLLRAALLYTLGRLDSLASHAHDRTRGPVEIVERPARVT